MELHYFLQKTYFSKLEFITRFKPDEIKFKPKKPERIEKVIFVDCANIFGTNFHHLRFPETNLKFQIR